MDPDKKKAGKFYQLFKVHKPHEPGKAPPERPITSNCGSITENIGKYVQVKLKPLSNQHPSYLQDSPDFLRALESLNEENVIEEGDILVTIDVSALYTNIPHDEAIKACKEALDETSDDKTKNKFITRTDSETQHLRV